MPLQQQTASAGTNGTPIEIVINFDSEEMARKQFDHIDSMMAQQYIMNAKFGFGGMV
ncbi:hypothetical protein [Bacillus fungorum]|uniref:hypothetical protein n=1 Tax=Bacillus fungorum TaxID=2039284 RepID=UPI00339B6CFB